MRKITIQRSSKILKTLVLLPFFAQTFISPIFALEELIPEDSTSVIEVDIPIDTSEDILDEGIATGPEDVVDIPELPVMEEELKPVWLENGYIATTNDVVVLGEVYTAPQNDAVSLAFSKLPEGSGYLTVNEITLTEEEVKATGAISNVAYDITTDMVDGTYEYDLTLPTTSDDVSVVYVESRDELLNGGTEVNETVSIEDGKVEIEGLEHFTVFVVVNPVNTTNCDAVYSPNGGCYTTIKVAIAASNDNDEIYVGSSYNSSIETFPIVVNKEVKIYGVSLPQIIAPDSFAFMIVSDNVTIDGFDISHTVVDDQQDLGILLSQVDGCQITNNNLHKNSVGIEVLDSGNNLIDGNTIGDDFVGIYFEGTTDGLGNFDVGSNGPFYSLSLNNVVSGNTITGSTKIDLRTGAGIYLDAACEFNTFDNNTISNNDADGFYSWKADNNTITNNTISNNGDNGIHLMGSSSNTITGNTLSNNTNNGFLLRCGALSSTLNIITDNTVTTNGTGFLLQDDVSSNNYVGFVSGNTINNNRIFGNTNYGMITNDIPTTILIDAKNNWWGNATGPFDNVNTDGSIPSDNLTGSGNTVSGTIDYSIWAVNSDFTFEEPVNLGWNIRSQSSTSADKPVDLVCGDITNADYPTYGDGMIAHNWEATNAPSNVKYQRQYMWPENSTWSTDSPAYTNTYTSFSTLGSSAGTEGEWNTRVRAWVDVNGNNILDEGIDTVSGWSNECTINYDRTTPTKPVITNSPDSSFTNVNSITVNWIGGDDEETTASGIKGYILRYVFTPANGDPDINWSTGLREVGNPKAHSGSYGHGEGKYVMYVKTVDNAGNESKWSEPEEVTIDTIQPEAPSGLYFMDLDNNQRIDCDGFSNTKHVSEHWDANTQEPNFSHYEYSSFNAPNGLAGLVSKIFTTNYFDSSWWLIPMEGTYGFQIRSVDLAGNKSDWALSNEVGIDHSCKINIDWAPPTTPDMLGFLNPDFPCGSTTNSTNITVDWSNSDGTGSEIKGYEYQINYPFNDTSRKVWTTFFTESENTGSLNEGTHYIRVRAQDMAGNWSNWSNEWIDPANLTGNEMINTCSITSDTEDPTIVQDPIDEELFLNEGDNIPEVTANFFDNLGLSQVHYNLTNTVLGWDFDDSKTITGTTDSLSISELIRNYATGQFGQDITTVDTFYMPEGTYVITYYAEDLGTNTSGTKTLTIHITNVAPTVDSFIVDVLSITEGDAVNFEAIFSDPAYIEYLSGEKHADDASWLYSFNPEGTYEPELSTNIPGETLAFAHTYNNEGTYSAEFKVCEDSLTDGEGECITETVDIVVSNNTPTINITPPSTTVTVGDPAVVLSTTVTNGNAPFTYFWSGDCTGTGDSNSVPTDTVREYTCTVQVTDADGDTTTSEKATVTVGAVLPASAGPDQSTGMGGYYFAQTPVDTGEEGEEEEEEETTEDEEEVLGETTCETTYKISGTVFYDKNDDGIYDDNEKGVSGIDVNIYDSNGDLAKTVQTDEDGYWEAYLCPGEYTTEVEGAENQEFILGESDKTLNIPVEKKFPWWWIAIIGASVLILLGFLVDRSKKKEELF